MIQMSAVTTGNRATFSPLSGLKERIFPMKCLKRIELTVFTASFTEK